MGDRSSSAPNAAAASENESVIRARRWLAEQPVPAYSALRQAFGFCGILVVVGIISFCLHRSEFKGDGSSKAVPETHPIVDGIYFIICVFCRVGYGDFSPHSPATKLFCCVFALVGVGFLQILLNRALCLVLKDVEEKICRRESRWRRIAHHVIDARTKRFSEKTKIILAFAMVVMCIVMGSLLIWLLEGRNIGDSVYMSIISVSAVGFGDIAFTTFYGRLFGSLWLLSSTTLVLMCFVTIIEARIRLEENRILQEVIVYFAKRDADRSSTQEKILTEDACLPRSQETRSQETRSQENLIRRNV